MNSAPSSDPRDLDSLVTVRAMGRGEKVFGRYVLERILGRGGMGVVWLALDTELEQQVALKFLPEVVLGDSVALDDLKRETRRSRELTHPHIVRIHDFLRDERTAAISMEFIDGSTLAERRLSQPLRIFEVETIVPWVRQVCEALDHAHTRPKAIIHRDLKPANLMVTAAGELKVTDFGIASSVSDSVSRVSMTMGSSGTPVYMSPQQMMGERPSVTDDIYALGATIYELLTSKPPFYSGNVPMQVQSRVPPSLAQRRAELEIEGLPIPPPWEELIAACLAKEPGGRPQSVRAIAGRLQLGSAGFAAVSDDVTIRSPGGALAEVPLEEQVTMVQRPTNGGGAAPSTRSTQKEVLPPPADVVRDETAAGASDTASDAAGTGIEESPAARPKRKGRALKWSIGLVTVGAIVAAAVWGGDVFGRYHAGQAAKRAASALLAGDWDGALGGYQTAVSLRPSDAEHQQSFDVAQQGWLRELTSRISTLSPEAALEQLKGAPSTTARKLANGYADQFRQIVEDTTAKVRSNVRTGLARAEGLAQRGRFAEAYAEVAGIEPYRDLVGDFEQEVDRLHAIEVRSALQTALGSAGKGDFEGAFGALSSVEAHRALVPEYDVTVTRVREAQVRHEINAALARSATGEFDGALEALEATEKREILSSEVVAAREQVRAAQVREEIRIAMASAAQGEFDRALEQLAATARRGALPAEVVSARTNVREAQVRHEIGQALGRMAVGDHDEALELLAATDKRGVLRGEVAAARTKVLEAQVRGEVGLALERLAQDDFKGAVARLDAVEKRGLLLPEIAAAREQVRRKGEETSVERLPRAIMSGDPAGVQAIIDDFSLATGHEFKTTGKQLLQETSLDGYLRALEELRLRPEDESGRRNRLDLILVEAQRARFDDRKAVSTFLGQGHAAWARELLENQQPGFALYVLKRARTEGVEIDPALERSALAALTREFDFRLNVARPETDRQTPAVLQAMPLKSLLSRLSSTVGGWMPVAEESISARAGSASAGFVLRTSVRGVDTQDNRSEETRHANYQSGWNEYTNPEYVQLASQLEQAQFNAQQAAAANAQNQQQVRSATNTGNLDRTSAVLFGVASGLSSISVTAAQREVSRLRGLLANTPRTVREPVYASEPYSVITHNLTYAADFAAEVEWRGLVVGVPQRFQSTATHQTVEVVGNSTRGVPVRRPEYPDSAAVAQRLASDLATQAERGADVILAALGDATFRALDSRLLDRKASSAEMADRRWGLFQLWSTSGVGLPAGDLERTVREHLGLPAVVVQSLGVADAAMEQTLKETSPAEVTPPPSGKTEVVETKVVPVIPEEKTPQPATAGAPGVYDVRELDRAPKVTTQARPVLSRELRRASLKGNVVLSFVVDSNGRVRDVEVVRSDHKQLEGPASDALMKWRYRPGEKNAKPVATRLQQTFVFK